MIIKNTIRAATRTLRLFVYLGRFSMPQSQSMSRTFIRERPRSVRVYSTLGGICG